MKKTVFSIVKGKTQELLALQFLSDEADIRYNNGRIIQEINLNKYVVRIFKSIAKHELGYEDKKELQEFIRDYIVSFLNKGLQYYKDNQFEFFSSIIVYTRNFHCSVNGDIDELSLEAIVANKKIKEEIFHVIKNHVDAVFYAVIGFVNSLLERLHNEEEKEPPELESQHREIGKYFHGHLWRLYRVAHFNTEWLQYCIGIGLFNYNVKFKLYDHRKDQVLYYLVHDVPLRVDYYHRLLSKIFCSDEARLLIFLTQQEMQDNTYQDLTKEDAELGILEFMSQKFSQSEFAQYLVKNKGGYQKSDFLEYLVDKKNFDPFEVGAVGIFIQEQPQLDCYACLINNGFNIFEINYFGFNIISLFIHYHSNNATHAIGNLLTYSCATPEVLIKIFQSCLTIFPVGIEWAEHEGGLSYCSYPRKMVYPRSHFSDEAPVSTVHDIALMHCCTDMIQLFVLWGIKLGNTAKQKLHDEVENLKTIVHGGEVKNIAHVDIHECKESLVELDEIGEKKLNLSFVYKYITQLNGFEFCAFKTICSFIFLSKLNFLGGALQAELSNKLANFDADGAFGAFSGFLSSRYYQLSTEIGKEVFKYTCYELPTVIIDIIVNQMLDDYWYLPFILIQSIADFLPDKQIKPELYHEQCFMLRK
jgi:hypothetical protein